MGTSFISHRKLRSFSFSVYETIQVKLDSESEAQTCMTHLNGFQRKLQVFISELMLECMIR